MASFLHAAAPRSEWSVEDAARFAARKEFELLRLLSTDAKALTTARRLGLPLGQAQPQTQHHAEAADAAAAAASSGAADASSAASCTMPRHARRRPARRAQRAVRADAQPQTPTVANAAVGKAAVPPVRVARPEGMRADGAVPRANARKRRSAARSARHHAARRRPIQIAAYAILYLLKLQRRARQRRAAAGLMELCSPTSPASASSKRGRSSSPASRRAGSSAGHTPASNSSCDSHGPEALEDCAEGSCGSCARCAREGRREHQRLRKGALAMLLAPS